MHRLAMSHLASSGSRMSVLWKRIDGRLVSVHRSGSCASCGLFAETRSISRAKARAGCSRDGTEDRECNGLRGEHVKQA